MENNHLHQHPGLAALTNLTDLDVHGNNITDISFVSGLQALFGLDVSQNLITDISPAGAITALNWLYAGGNQIASADVLDGMPFLYALYLSGNPLPEVDFLANMPRNLMAGAGQHPADQHHFPGKHDQPHHPRLSYIPAASVTPLYHLTNSWSHWLFLRARPALDRHDIRDGNDKSGFQPASRITTSPTSRRWAGPQTSSGSTWK